MPKRKHAGRSPGGADHPEEGMVVLHRSSFIDWKPSPIVSLASSGDGSLSVALRENGDLELYESSSLMQFQRIPGHTDAAPTSVAVMEESGDAPCRIFVSGLDGNIVEVDAENAHTSAVSDSYGGAVWQLAAEPATEQPAAGTSPAIVPGTTTTGTAAAGADNSGSDSDDDTNNKDVNVGLNGINGSSSASPRLAAACDDGCVRLFTVEPGVPGAAYSKSLPRVEGRVLAIAWHPYGRVIVSGGTDGCIHAWDVASGRELLRVTAGDGSGRDMCVWCLLVLPDGTIVSGDSGGNVAFWDARNGTQIARFSQHAADVLQLAASPDGNTVFAAGIDPKIAVFKRVKGQKHQEASWTFLSAKRPHSHDVRALCIAAGKNAGEPRLFSGGNDTVLIAHSVGRFLKEHPKKVNACPQRPLICTARAAAGGGSNDSAAAGAAAAALKSIHSSSPPWLLVAEGNAVDVWQLSRPATAIAGGAEGDGVLPQAMPLHLARLVNKGGAFISSAAISSDGSRIAFSDSYRVRCFTVEEVEEGNAAERVAMGGAPHLSFSPVPLRSDLPPATHLHFHPESGDLVALGTDGTLRVLRIEVGKSATAAAGAAASSDNSEDEEAEERKETTAVVQHTIRELHDLRYKMWYKRDKARSSARRLMPAVDLAAWSPDGQWLAAVVRGRVHLLALSSHRIAAQLPLLGDHTTTLAAIGFTPDSSTVAVVTTTNQVAAYDVPGGQPTEWTERHASSLPRRLLTLPGPVCGIARSPAGSDSVLLFSPEAVCHVNFGAPVASEPSSSKRRREREPAMAARVASPEGQNMRALYCGDPVLHVEALGDNEVLVVERSWADVWKGLAPPLYRHRYGT